MNKPLKHWVRVGCRVYDASKHFYTHNRVITKQSDNLIELCDRLIIIDWNLQHPRIPYSTFKVLPISTYFDPKYVGTPTSSIEAYGVIDDGNCFHYIAVFRNGAWVKY